LKLDGDTFSFADPRVKRIDEQTIEETDKREGKVVEVIRFTISSDGRTMSVSMKDIAKSTTSEFVLHKE